MYNRQLYLHTGILNSKLCYSDLQLSLARSPQKATT